MEMTSVHGWPRLAALALLLGLSACGGGGGGSDAPADPPPGLPGALTDPATYAADAGAALDRAVEAAATTSHSIILNGRPIAYTAKAGHLTAKAPGTGQDQASFFYVAYSADGQAAASRPVTFFYNGGPGSASVWLHLGSYGPKRLATGMPATTLARPFALVDNAESLLDTSDLVFVNAVGSGLSQAIAPFTNSSFWGVDRDAAVFRDFVQRYIAVYERQSSPKYLFGESYGGPRTAVLAGLLESAGVKLTGLVLQAPAMDYNSNCGVTGEASIGCGGYLPSYAATGQHYQLLKPQPSDLGAYMTQMRDFSYTRYSPAVAALLQGAAVPTELPPLLSGYTGLAATEWMSSFNLQPDRYRGQLLPGSVIGRYDARVSAPLGSTLASEGDPSSTIIGASFATAIAGYLRDTLRYNNPSNYVLLSKAIESWDFRHAGKSLPDTIPDLGAALALNPDLRVLTLNGYHDLATPFYQTELDLARLKLPGRVLVRNYAGGHMTYLDDGSRVAAKADLVAFYRGTLTATATTSTAPARPQAVGPLANDGHAKQPAPAALPNLLPDPWVPPALRPQAPTPPPSQGKALQGEIEGRMRALRQPGAQPS